MGSIITTPNALTAAGQTVFHQNSLKELHLTGSLVDQLKNKPRQNKDIKIGIIYFVPP
jgi:hypothetical protein